MPTDDDTLWLECTSDYSAYNDPPASIEGVNVLLVKPGGSTLVRTPVSPASANRSKLSAKARLLENRALELRGSLSFTGNLAMDTRWLLSSKNARERREWLAQRIADKSGSATCKDVEISGLDNPDTTLVVRFAAHIDYFARKAGTRYLVRPRLYHRVQFDGEAPKERTTALLNLTRFVQEDEVEFTMPETWRLRHTITKDSLVAPFGQFSYELSPVGNKLLWKSAFVSEARKVSLDDYHDYYNFISAIKKLSRKKLVLENTRS